MVSFLLKKSKKKTKVPKAKASSRKSNGKKLGENFTSKHTLMVMRTTFNIKVLSLLLKNRRIQKSKIIMPRG